MCGRATFADRNGVTRLEIGFTYKMDLDAFTPKYNIRPTDQIPVLRQSRDGECELTTLRWWLISYWTKEPLKFPTFNARAESIAEKPAFRDSFRERRCLVLVDGFYEWPKKEPWQKALDKRSRLIRFADRRIMTLAGLWDRWRDERTGVRVESCTIVTTEANGLLESVPHDRMPVVLDGDAREAWLDRSARSPSALRELQQLFVPRVVDDMEATIVSSEFVNYGIDDERCVEPVGSP